MRRVRGQERVGSLVALTSVKERVQVILAERHDEKYYNWKMVVCLAISALLIL